MVFRDGESYHGRFEYQQKSPLRTNISKFCLVVSDTLLAQSPSRTRFNMLRNPDCFMGDLWAINFHKPYYQC